MRANSKYEQILLQYINKTKITQGSHHKGYKVNNLEKWVFSSNGFV